jgi:hypothetical protein
VHPRSLTKRAFPLALSALAICALLSPARAQEARRLAEPDSIPLDLAAALVSAGGFGGEPQILVGTMPEWIAPKLFVPPGGHVLGSAFLGTTLVAVVSVSTTSDSVLADFKRGLMQRGWTAAPPTPVYAGGGFRPATMAVPSSPFARDVLCSDQQMLTASATRRRGVATDITLRVTSTTGFSLCHPSQPNMPQVRSPMPTLYNPVGANDARMTGDCNSLGFVNSTGTGTSIRTPMAADALLDHYAKQLADSGWKSAGETNTITGRTWTRPDSTGTPVEVTITVTSSGQAGCRELSMQVRTMRKP